MIDINERFEKWACRPSVRYDVNFAGYEKWASAMDGFIGGWFDRQKEIDNLKASLTDAIEKAKSQRYDTLWDDDQHEGYIHGLEHALELLTADVPTRKCSTCGGDGYSRQPSLGDNPCEECNGTGVAADVQVQSEPTLKAYYDSKGKIVAQAPMVSAVQSDTTKGKP